MNMNIPEEVYDIDLDDDIPEAEESLDTLYVNLGILFTTVGNLYKGLGNNSFIETETRDQTKIKIKNIEEEIDNLKTKINLKTKKKAKVIDINTGRKNYSEGNRDVA